MKVLFVNCCPRGEASRTLALARRFLGGLKAAEIITHDLCSMNLPPVNAEILSRRETVCDARDWNNPIVQPAVEFVRADLIVIAAPYWDLSFPSMLKIWVEHMWVRNLTFHYEHDTCIGHCRASHCVYITTSGSPVGENDWGTGYIRAVMKALGVKEFHAIKAEGIDLDGADVAEILAAAAHEAALLAEEIQ